MIVSKEWRYLEAKLGKIDHFAKPANKGIQESQTGNECN